MQAILIFRQGLELALGGLALMVSQAVGAFAPAPAAGLQRHYAMEAIAVSMLVVVAVLSERWHGQAHLERGVREVNNFLVEKGLISAEEKEEYDHKAIEQISDCCEQ